MTERPRVTIGSVQNWGVGGVQAPAHEYVRYKQIYRYWFGLRSAWQGPALLLVFAC